MRHFPRFPFGFPRAVLFAVLTLVMAAPAAPQTVPTPDGHVFTLEEMESLLTKGRITNRRSTPKGVTNAVRVTLTLGSLSHDAQVQNVDIFRQVFDVAPEHTELNFRDTYRYNIAAYRLARALGFDNVPMSVPRTVDGKPSSVTWWVDDVAMDEAGRLKLPADERRGPNPSRTSAYIHLLRVFDELIQNRDRNSGNLLWTRDWTMWMIDHTRAFRLGAELRAPHLLERIERGVFAALKGLTRDALKQAVGDALVNVEIDALLKRRDLLVSLFDRKVAQQGEASILYTLPR